MRSTAAVILLTFICAPVFAAGTPPPTQVSTGTDVLQIDRTATGQPIALPTTAHVMVNTSELAPKQRLPVHKHPYQRYVYVLAGVLDVVNDETGERRNYPAGSFFAEMRDTWHHGENTGGVPTKLLIIDQVPPGVESNMVRKEKP